MFFFRVVWLISKVYSSEIFSLPIFWLFEIKKKFRVFVSSKSFIGSSDESSPESENHDFAITPAHDSDIENDSLVVNDDEEYGLDGHHKDSDEKTEEEQAEEEDQAEEEGQVSNSFNLPIYPKHARTRGNTGKTKVGRDPNRKSNSVVECLG